VGTADAITRSSNTRMQARCVTRSLNGHANDWHRRIATHTRATVRRHIDILSNCANISRSEPLTNLVMNVIPGALNSIPFRQTGDDIITTSDKVDPTVGLWCQSPDPVWGFWTIKNGIT
jgi:hypothetical protein